MSARERDVNEGLRALDDAHRLGRLSREEYRARRRRLLATLNASDSVITRRTTTHPTAPRQPPVYDGAGSAEVLPSLFPPRSRLIGGRALIWATCGLLCALLAYWLLAT